MRIYNDVNVYNEIHRTTHKRRETRSAAGRTARDIFCSLDAPRSEDLTFWPAAALLCGRRIRILEFLVTRPLCGIVFSRTHNGYYFRTDRRRRRRRVTDYHHCANTPSLAKPFSPNVHTNLTLIERIVKADSGRIQLRSFGRHFFRFEFFALL